LRPRVDLNLIRDSLRQLNDSTYFESRLHEFTDHLVRAINHVLASPGKYDPRIEQQFAILMHVVQSHLAGSTANEIPFEVVYCLRDALRRWSGRRAAIVTELTAAHDFRMIPVDPWEFIRSTLAGYDTGGFEQPLVMIGVPRLYAHKPIFCIPLYHELGHFVDTTNRISEASMLVDRSPIATPGADELSYRREFFADLFAACFIGSGSVSPLSIIAPNVPPSRTHPSTRERKRVVDAFLAGSSEPIVTMFQNILVRQSLPPLQRVAARVSVDADFDELRTFQANSIEEVHGLYESAWNYMFTAIDGGRNPWEIAPLTEGAIEAISNDLTEKSIRNFAIRTAWNEAATTR
jgi:hypothetical protein